MALNWEGYEAWSMVKYEIPKDGNCLFHAIALAFFKPYINENFNNRPISRNQIVYNLRKELSDKLSQPVNGKSGPTYYEKLNNSNTLKFSKYVPEFSLKHMQAELNSNHHIGYGYLEYIANQINKDIFILDANHKLYPSDEITVKGRNAIVLYYQDNHYELIGVNGMTHFKPNHPFILFLKMIH